MRLSPSPDPEPFLREAERITAAAQSEGLHLRLVGAIAFRLHCPRFVCWQDMLGRIYTDLDFAGYSNEADRIIRVMGELGYEEDREISIYFGRSRLVFDHRESGMHCDVFLDKLDFCHEIPWLGRLEVDFPTIPLAELLLEKMQIARINEKDIMDTIMLVREHPVGDTDHETVNSQVIGRSCASDWGLWRTATMNLRKTEALMQGYEAIPPEDKEVVKSRVGQLLQRIDEYPKSLAWRVRNRIGDRIKWYKDVEELVR